MEAKDCYHSLLLVQKYNYIIPLALMELYIQQFEPNEFIFFTWRN